MNYPSLIKALESMSELDFEATPAVRITARLRDKLIAHHFDPAAAEEIACSVEIDLPLDPAEDEIVERISSVRCPRHSSKKSSPKDSPITRT